MTDEQSSNPDANQQTIYQFKLKGHLGQQWMNWFEGLTVTLEEDGNTLLSGIVVDQSALHGILKKIRDLGMPLLTLSQVEPKDVEMKISTKSVKQSRSKRRKKS
ncbi:MAG: hypothetical protein J0L96_00445 [Anaerolineae bacterium]|nr:hypothetical protein [Anaerolineae bacterium]